MSGVTIAFASFVVITVLIYAGMHISTALFITSLVPFGFYVVT